MALSNFCSSWRVRRCFFIKSIRQVTRNIAFIQGTAGAIQKPRFQIENGVLDILDIVFFDSDGQRNTVAQGYPKTLSIVNPCGALRLAESLRCSRH